MLPQPLGAPLPLALALLTVARPLASPTPLPFTPLLRNMGAFLCNRSSALSRNMIPDLLSLSKEPH
jgi:hypothetical protein